MTFSLTSPVFSQGDSIPSQYTCDGANMSPPLVFGDVPEGTQSFALIMDDPDVPKQLRPDGVFDHWVMFNIPPATVAIAEGESLGISGANGVGKATYTGPCPPSQYEPSEHRYFFRAYALDTMLSISEKSSKSDVLAAIETHVLGEAALMGRYKRVK
ncbi:YbhB/YbcL family Raf kinase inhibitor-like protein [Candidatus Kaiserbacteria bacterium]|nr:YbhB/YbcL family Raf kinase inhibitor-like protein [Candidatus Kaiserbacteria bacterium]